MQGVIVLSGRRVEPLEEIAADIVQRGGKVSVAPLDVSDKAHRRWPRGYFRTAQLTRH